MFSVATTSTKPPAVIKAGLRRVLDRIQVQYRETKTGFDCIYLPSIEIPPVQDPGWTIATPSPPRKHRKRGSAVSGDSGGTAKQIVRKALKLPFGMGRKDKDRGGGEASVDGSTPKEKEKDLPDRASGSGGSPPFSVAWGSSSSSFFIVSSNTATPHADDASATLHLDDSSRRSHSPARIKNLSPTPRDFDAGGAVASQQHEVLPTTEGEVDDREVFVDVRRNTVSVRFEINLVKVSFVNFVQDPDMILYSISPFFSSGSMVAVTRYPISSCGRRWMAVPDACATSPG